MNLNASNTLVFETWAITLLENQTRKMFKTVSTGDENIYNLVMSSVNCF